MRKPSDIVRPEHRRGVTAAVVILAIVISGLAIVTFHSTESIPGELVVQSGEDPSESHRITTLRIFVRNEGTDAIEPRFNIVHSSLQTRFYWSVTDGPEYLAGGQAATYVIEAPVVSAGIPYNGSAVISVNDAGTDRQLKTTWRSPQRDPPAVMNPWVAHWIKHPNAEGYKPFRWATATSSPGNETTTVERINGRGVRLGVQDVTRSEGPWGMAGIVQNGAFPETIRVEATPHTVVQEPTRYPSTATGIEIGEDDHRVWIVFADVEDREVLYRGGDLNYIMVFIPAEPGERVTTTVDVQALYSRFGWETPPPGERVVDGATYAQPRAHVLAFTAVYPGHPAERAEMTLHRVDSIEDPGPIDLSVATGLLLSVGDSVRARGRSMAAWIVQSSTILRVAGLSAFAVAGVSMILQLRHL